MANHESLARSTARVGFYSESTEIGGAERALLHLLCHASNDHQLVLCSRHPELLDEASRRVPQVERHLVGAGGDPARTVTRHRKLFRSLDLDLLQVTLGNPFRARPAMVAAFSLRLPTIAVEQLVLPSRRRRGRLLKRAMSRPLAAHVAVGERSAGELARFYGLPASSVTVIHNGIPDDHVDEVPFDDRPVVGCAARLEDQKRVDVLIDAMARLPDARLVLVGDGANRLALERQARDRGCADRVEFTGWVDDARPAIKGFDVFALPSQDESFPLTIVEAMLSRTAVVATDVGSVSEAVIDGETGLLVPVGDIDALSAGIARLLGDPALRADVTSRARTLAVERFTVPTMVAAYERLWSDVLARRRRRRPVDGSHSSGRDS